MKYLLFIFLLATCTQVDNSDLVKRVESLEAKSSSNSLELKETNYLLAETSLKLQCYVDSLAILSMIVKSMGYIDLSEITSEIEDSKARIENLEASDNYLYDEINLNIGNIANLGVDVNRLSQDVFSASTKQSTDSAFLTTLIDGNTTFFYRWCYSHNMEFDSLWIIINSFPGFEIQDSLAVDSAENPMVKVYGNGAYDYWQLEEYIPSDTIYLDNCYIDKSNIYGNYIITPHDSVPMDSVIKYLRRTILK